MFTFELRIHGNSKKNILKTSQVLIGLAAFVKAVWAQWGPDMGKQGPMRSYDLRKDWMDVWDLKDTQAGKLQSGSGESISDRV